MNDVNIVDPRRLLPVISLCVLFTLSALNTSADESKPLPTIIIAGQSNAYRLGGISSRNVRPDENPLGAPLFYYANPKCTDAKAVDTKLRTIQPDEAVDSYGAGLAKKLGEQYPDGFAIIRYAVCGSTLHTDWMPTKQEGYYHQYFEPFVAKGIEEIERISRREPQVVGMFWHQGESNSDTEESVTQYRLLMPKLIDQFQTRYGRVPFILGSIREFDDQPLRAEINRHMQDIAKNYDQAVFVSIQDVEWQSPTNVHFSVKGGQEVGQRFGKAFFELIKADSTPKRNAK